MSQDGFELVEYADGSQECVVWGQGTIVLVAYVLMFVARYYENKGPMSVAEIIVALILLILLGTCFVAARESMSLPHACDVLHVSRKKMRHGATSADLSAPFRERKRGVIAEASLLQLGGYAEKSEGKMGEAREQTAQDSGTIARLLCRIEDKKHNEKAISFLSFLSS